jgi:lipoprotein NlpI
MTRAKIATIAGYVAVCIVMPLWLLFQHGSMQEAARQRAACVETAQYRDRNTPERIIAACTVLIAAGRGAPDELALLHFKRGVARVQARQFALAAADFDDALKLRPGYQAAYSNRAICYFNLGQNQKALDDFASALKLRPGDFYALTVRGTLYDRMRQPQKAQADFASAERLAPKDPQS